jgi:hypothetical protein
MKNLEYVIKKTAADLNLPESVVRPIVTEYWKASMENIVKLKATTTSIRYVGNFAVVRFKLYQYIRKMIGKIRRVRKSPNISEEKRSESIATYTAQLRLALRERDILAHHYQKMFKQK